MLKSTCRSSIRSFALRLPYKQFLGYRKGVDGLPEIIPEEAEIVRNIYRQFMQGQTPHSIAKALTAEGIPTPGGKTVWQSSTVESILKNEKYRGDARLQKSFTVDFLQKKMKINEGEVPQYYVENSHPAIIAPEEWDLVQAEFTRRKSMGHRYSSSSIFASKLVCGDCGGFYGSKVWHSNSIYRRTIWRCNEKYHGEHRCTTTHLYEETIKALFLQAFSKVMEARTNILEDLRMAQDTLCDCSAIDEEMKNLEEELEIRAEVIRRCVEENTTSVQDQDEYQGRYERITARYEKLKKHYGNLEKERQRRKEKYDVLSAFMFKLMEQDQLPIEFSDELWTATIDHVTVNPDERLVFCFKGGMEVTERL